MRIAPTDGSGAHTSFVENREIRAACRRKWRHIICGSIG